MLIILRLFTGTTTANTQKNKLCSLFSQTLSRFTVPVQDISYMNYEKEKWEKEEVCSFNNYGWFQFSRVQNALLSHQSLALAIQLINTLKEISPVKKLLLFCK